MLKILLIEDDQVDQIRFRRTLKDSSHDVSIEAVDSISAAQKAITTAKPELVFCDFNLPDGNALNFLDSIQIIEDTKVVVMTGLGDVEKATESLKKGAFDFITKDNLDLPAIDRIINNFLRLKAENDLRKKLEVQLQKNYNNTKSILDHSNDGIWSLSRDKSLIFANGLTEKSLSKYFNCQIKEGDQILEIVPEQFSKEWSKMFDEAIQGKSVRQTNKFFDGKSDFYLETSCNPIYNGDLIDGVVFVSRNVTKRELSEDKLRESEKNFRSVFEGSDVPILVEELEGNTIVDLNEAAATLHNYKAEEMIGMSIYDTIPPDFLKKSQDNYHKLLDEELDYLESYVYTSDKRSIPVRIDINEIIYQGKKCNLLFMNDISLQKKQEDELKKAREFAEQTAEFKSLFLANMSHEIRTPMNALIGFADLLKGTTLDHEQKEYVDVIKRSGEDLLVIINDILDLSKIQAGKMELRLQAMNLHQMLKQLLQLHKYKAEDKGLILDLTVVHGVPEFIEADPTRLAQILNNLVSNSIKFTEKGNVSIKVRLVGDEGGDNTIHFEVKDTGIGIPKDKLDQVFQDFSQVDSTFQRKHKGTGLGLSITKELVELMGGSIEVKSQIDHGSTFCVQLQFKTASPQVQSSSTQMNNQGFQDINLLVVEDNEVNILLAKRILGKLNIQAEFAENGKVAVEKTRQMNPNIIFMDIQMPVLDGLEATRLIREFSDVPILAMTAHVLDDEREKCMEAGMNGFISKPFKKADIYNALLNTKTYESSVREEPNSVESLGIDTLSEMAEGDVDFTVKLLETFIKNSANAIAEMNNDLKEDKTEAIKFYAHKMRSAFVVLELVQLQELSVQIEQDPSQKEKVIEFVASLSDQIKSVKEMTQKLGKNT